jgi:hypothetical protein
MDQRSQSRITQEARSRPYQTNARNTHHYRTFTAQTTSESETYSGHTPIDTANYPINNLRSSKNTAKHRQTRAIIGNNAQDFPTDTACSTTQIFTESTHIDHFKTQHFYNGDCEARSPVARQLCVI